jgi:hypothetical protein
MILLLAILPAKVFNIQRVDDGQGISMKHIPAVGITLATICGAAAPQYRQEQPAVIQALQDSAQTGSHEAEVVASFRERYRQASTPSIALFWNRELSDAIARRMVNKTTTEAAKFESESAGGDAAGNRSERQENSSSATTNTQETVEDGPKETLDPRSDSVLKSAFVSTLRAADARLVDRTVMVRSNAMQQAQGADSQLNEMQSLKNDAQLLMQIVFVKDARSSLGYGFKVSVTDVRNDLLITEFYTTAVPAPHGPSGYVASNGDRGFQRASQPAPTVNDIGRALAIEIMGQLGASL